MPLSFFTNSGNSYGSAIPFQRIVEPAQLGFFLNLEQTELLRIQRYNEAWRFFFGRHWLFKREDGEPLVTLNYFRKIIDKSVDFLMGKGFVINTSDALEEVTKPFLDEVWEYNKRGQFGREMATIGAVTGDAFILVTFEEPSPMQKKINPFSQGRVRINLLGSEQVYPTWDPLNTDTLIAARIETIYYAERGTRQLDRDDRANHEGRQLYTKRFTQILTRDQIVEQFHGDMPVIKRNPLGEIPLVHIKNLGVPREFYGLPDAQDLIDLNRELNEKATDISDIINYHAAPITVITGAKAKQLERGPRQIWSGLPQGARVENLQLGGDLTAANTYFANIKKTMFELSDVPEGALGSMQPISNTSGVALHIQYQPLIEKTDRKKIYYEPGISQINYFALRIGMLKGLINLPFDICENCGGRIIELATDKKTMAWDPELPNPTTGEPGYFVEVPVTKKKCFHIDKQTLDFTDPEEMRIQFWKKYGFGNQLREMRLKDILRDIQNDEGSFWDYTILQKQLQEQWKSTLAKDEATAHQHTTEPMATIPDENAPAPSPPAPGEGGGGEPPAPAMKVVPVPKMPLEMEVTPLPPEDIDIPEEPEEVTIKQQWVHPQTGVLLMEKDVTMFLVPTSCKKPKYLNPFQTRVQCLDVLPKDEALEAQLLMMYQTNEWADAEWCRGQLPRLAADKAAIERRMKDRQAAMKRLQPVMQQRMPGDRSVDVYQEAAPPMPNPAMVPGQGGNPVPPGSPQAGGR